MRLKESNHLYNVKVQGDSNVIEAAASFQKGAVRVHEDAVDEATFVVEKKIQSGTVRTKKDVSECQAERVEVLGLFKLY